MQKSKLLSVVFTTLIWALNSCHSNTNVESDTTQAVQKTNWIDSFDLDGDGKNDNIYFDYSGGAHCCYTMSIKLSSDTTKHKFDFEMDGGYIFGVDDSQPEHFNIKDFDGDGLPEIFMEINTYNGELHPIPTEWHQKYGIKSNYILIEYDEKKLIAKDYQLK